MKMGAEPKKIILLGLLVVGGLYSLYTNVLSGPSTPTPTTAAKPSPVTVPDAPTAPKQHEAIVGGPRRSANSRVTGSEFHPKIGTRPGEQRDPMAVDPTLRVDKLAKVQAVEPAGGIRNIFQFGKAEAPADLSKIKEPDKIKPGLMLSEKMGPPVYKPPLPPGPPPPPPPLQTGLKYYGFTTTKNDGRKRAFFMDGEAILVAGEGETVKTKYKVVRIGVNSAVLEEVDSKRQQTLPLAEEAQG